MRKFEVGKYYKPATMPSIDALKCIKVTNCYVWFYDDEKECEVKAKKGEGTYFNGNDVEKWEQVKIYGYLKELLMIRKPERRITYEDQRNWNH